MKKIKKREKFGISLFAYDMILYMKSPKDHKEAPITDRHVYQSSRTHSLHITKEERNQLNNFIHNRRKNCLGINKSNQSKMKIVNTKELEEDLER